MGKYEPLQKYLEQRKNTHKDIYLSFAKIEEIISDKLPPSAFEYREWWANELVGSHVQAQAWMNAGWKVESVDFTRKSVRFIIE